MINISEILKTKEPKAGSTSFISVDGHGGSGKTTLGKLLSEKLKAELIHTDDFASWDNPTDWCNGVIETVFKPIASDAQTLTYQPTSWWENHNPEKIVDKPVTEVMILEGVSSSRREFRDYLSLSIFVDTPNNVCLERGIERDKSTGESEEKLREMWLAWIDEEEKYFTKDNPKEYADVIVSGLESFESQIEF